MRERKKKINRQYIFLRNRSAKRLRRKNRSSDSQPNPPLKERPIKVTPKQKRKKYEPKNEEITFPADFDIVDKPNRALNFLNKLREKIMIKPVKQVRLDHQSLDYITPESAILLIAELYRADVYANRCKKIGTLAANPAVAELLQKIGYWQYFGVAYNGKSKFNRQFMIHKTGNRIESKLVKDAIIHFREAITFTRLEEKRLFVAIVECLDNVMNHAYPYQRKYSPPRLRHQWWFLASHDSKTKEVSFCFYDHGMGITNTIKKRVNQQMQLIPESDGEMIIKAVTEGHYSRHAQKTRGTGLPSLKQFIDEAESGELIIVTDKTKCTFAHNSTPQHTTFASSAESVGSSLS